VENFVAKIKSNLTRRISSDPSPYASNQMHMRKALDFLCEVALNRCD